MSISPTPLPFRSPDQDELRRSFENELLHEQANVIYWSSGVSLVVPMRIRGRMLKMAQAYLPAAGTSSLFINGTLLHPQCLTNGYGTMTIITGAEVNPGTYTITMTSTQALTDTIIIVRRGKIPPAN